MPTSSQAMILRGADVSARPVSVTMKSLVPFKIDNETREPAVSYSAANNNNHGPCERVQFDFSLSATPERGVNGFEGVFSYDQNSKSYRWQIYSLSGQPKECGGIPAITNGARQDGGDHNICTELNEESTPYIMNQTSEYNGHFTTPASSLMDASPEGCVGDHHAKTSDSFHFMNEEEYRRLENLGFRRRTTYSSGGNLVRMERGASSALKSPEKCAPEQLNTPKLSVNNLNRTTVLNPKRTSDEFPPQSCVTGESMRRRIPPVKAKSLLDEVKDSVRWSDRVAPSVAHRRTIVQNILDAVCFSLEDSWKYDHSQVRDLIESQINCKVKTLQYDPLTIRTGDPNVLDRWIVTFNSKTQCNKVIERGLAVDGKRVIVRSWDDVVREEMGEDWDYRCSYRLPNERHDRILRKFLQAH
ncbi:hypothetical protein ACF0H5_009942 [Mactra antiquata]